MSNRPNEDASDDRKKKAAERIRELRESLGMDQPEFARFLGLPSTGQASVSKWESAKSAPGAKAAALLAKRGGGDPLYYQGLEPIPTTAAANVRVVKVVGAVQAGSWREAVEFPPDEQWDVPLQNVPGLDMQGFVVRGTSMDQMFPEGTIVFVASTISNGIHPKSGDYVLVQRTDENGLHEASLKQLIEDIDGTKWLWPRSNDPRFQTPLQISAADDPIITGRVMSYQGFLPLQTRGRKK